MVVEVRVKIDNGIKKIAENSLKMFRNRSEFCKYFNVSWKTYRGWFWNDCRNVPFEFVKSACELNYIDVWDFLEGKEILGRTGGVGGRSRLVFHKSTFNRISNSIGWLLSDGNINKNGRRINFSQKETIVLIKIIKDLHDASLLQKIPKMKPDGNSFAFEINSAPFGFLLTNYLNLQAGKRSNFVIPRIIWAGKNENKFAFLAGIFEGDGTFTGEYKRPMIHLEMNDIRFVNEVRHLLMKLRFNPTRISKHRDCFSFSLARRNEIELFMKNIRPFIKHPKTSQFIVKYGVTS